MATTTTTDGTKATIAISGWLDTNTAPELAKAIDQLDNGVTELVIDLADLEYISSAGLRQLVVAHRKTGGNLTISNVPADVMAVLTMAGFDKRLHIV